MFFVDVCVWCSCVFRRIFDDRARVYALLCVRVRVYVCVMACNRSVRCVLRLVCGMNMLRARCICLSVYYMYYDMYDVCIVFRLCVCYIFACVSDICVKYA